VVVVDANVEIDAPIVVVHWNDGADAAVFPRLVVRAGANSHALLVEHTLSSADTLMLAPSSRWWSSVTPDSVISTCSNWAPPRGSSRRNRRPSTRAPL
jgi:hypothetical protein